MFIKPFIISVCMVGGVAVSTEEVIYRAVRSLFLNTVVGDVVLLPLVIRGVRGYDDHPTATRYSGGVTRVTRREGLVTEGELTRDSATGRTAFRKTNFFTHRTDVLCDDDGDGSIDRVVLGVAGGDILLDGLPINGKTYTQPEVQFSPGRYERLQQEFTEALRSYDLSNPVLRPNTGYRGTFDGIVGIN